MRLKGERGSALLEVALTLPLVLFVSVGIFEFGRAYQVFQVCTNATREGARIAVLPGSTDSDVTTRVTDYLNAGQVTQTPSASWVVIDHPKTVSLGGATAPATQVTLNYPFSFIVLNPIAKMVVSSTSLGNAFTMSTSALMRNE